MKNLKEVDWDKAPSGATHYNEECFYPWLKETIDSGSLTPAPGFFFGPLEVREEDANYLKEVIELAERYLKEGVTVFYTSWW